MIKSMTGYGRYEETIDGRHIICEMRSVNHKYFECGCRISRGYLFLEDKVKRFVREQVSRGKVDVFIQIETLEEADVKVLVNHSLAAAYYQALKELQVRYDLEGEITLADITKNPELFSIHKAPDDEEKVWAAVRMVLAKALEAFVAMRIAEGGKLEEDILAHMTRILRVIDEVEQRAPETVTDYQKRLEERIEAILDDNRYDEQRVLTEVAIFADKVAVDEETVRIRSHFKQFEAMLGSDQPVGRKMDFIVQEMNREANTIASKSMNSDISYMVVDIKAEIEKIREQVQNIE